MPAPLESAIETLRAAFHRRPWLVLVTTPISNARTRIWWRDPLRGERRELIDVSDRDIPETVGALLAEIESLRKPKTKGASA